MQPDKQFNYWDNTSPNPAPINPSVPPAPTQPAQQTVSVQSPSLQPSLGPTQPVASPIFADPIEQPVAMLATEAVPTAMYEPKDQPVEIEPEIIDEQDDDQPEESEDYDEEPVHWSASEYVQQEKNSIWFIVSAVVAIGLIALDVFFLKSYTFSALVVVMIIAMIILSRRPPAEVEYTLSPGQGIYVGEVLHVYDEFKSFGVINDNGKYFIKLIPVKRFSLGVSVYFPDELGEVVVDILGARLPMEDLKLDAVDVVVRKLRL